MENKSITNNKFYVITLLLLLLLFGYLMYNVIRPFLTPIAWAVVLGIVFYPVYQFIGRYVAWKSAASLLTVLIIVFIIIGPFTYIIVMMGWELYSLVEHLEKGVFDQQFTGDLASFAPLKWLDERLHIYEYIGTEEVKKKIMDSISSVAQGIMPRLTIGFKNLLGVFSDFSIMVMTLYFFFLDGPAFVKKVRDYLPFTDVQKDRLVSQTKDMVVSAIYGGVAVALSQGIAAGLVFYFLGVRAPLLLGAATYLMSFIPFGAVIIWGGVDIYLFLSGSYIKGGILLFVGLFGISMIDNVLRPIIVSGRTNISFLLIFFTVVGGLGYFGLIGLILGPLVVVIFLSLFEIFRTIDEEEINGSAEL
ncbi:AI-2E family transporter [Candidatus Magnetominusculus xianensis]|nr:AI-2E family transporter [Candidatus Magnetominusculus xianensis]MBF0402505.1 AI-2E family transporter [Nitrospirota bacterium]